MLFAERSLARRIDCAEASLVSDVAKAAAARQPGGCHLVLHIDTGVAAVASLESPINKMVGIGFDGTIDELALAAVEQAHVGLGVSLRAEIATLVDPSIFTMFMGRGYRLLGFENVLGLSLNGPAGCNERATPSGLVITEVGPAGIRDWIGTVAEGFAHPDTPPGDADTSPERGDALGEMFEGLAAAAGFTRHVATLNGATVGAAGMYVNAGVALLAGASTLPAWRRRGVQSTLLAARLERARHAGADLAVMTTEPGSRSQQNGQRQGFALLYSRAILVKSVA